jgi:hypothetical protein
MGFISGNITCRRFAVIGEIEPNIEQSILDRLADNALKESDMGVPEEVEYGWCGGRHILDGAFSFDNNVYADAIHLAMRVDTNRVPGELKRAWQIMEEEATAARNPSGFISRLQKREVKDVLNRKIDDAMRSGQYRRSRLVPVLWDFAQHTIYSPASGANLEKLQELFERTFGLSLLPLTAGAHALRLLEPKGRRRDYEDMRPTRFAQGPDGEGQWPEYPWVAKGPEPKDFVGNEFLLWLWHEADARSGMIQTQSAGQVTVYIDRSLDIDCAYGQTGRDALRGDGPSRMPEARDALRTGKLPRRAGLVLEAHRQQYNLTLNPETLGISSAKLPEVEEAENPRVLFEERIAMLRDLYRAIDALFETFLTARAGSAWEGQTSAIRRWILQPQPRPIAAVA